MLILLEPPQPDGIGEAVLAGVAITKVNVVRELDPFAEVVEGNTTSLRMLHGRTRIPNPPGTGEKWCVVRISDRPSASAVFELPTTKWKNEGMLSAYPPEPDGWAKMPGCKPVFYFADGYTYC
ncbi:MAG: hypothetical protein R3C99_21040 [Pirellulaceae bacterium]